MYYKKQSIKKRLLSCEDGIPIEKKSPFIVAAEKEAIRDQAKMEVYEKDLNIFEDKFEDLLCDREHRE